MAASSFLHCARLARACVCLKQRVIQQTARREVGHRRAQAKTSRVRCDRALAVCPDRPTKSSPISRAAIRRRRPRAPSTPTSGTRSSEPAPGSRSLTETANRKKRSSDRLTKELFWFWRRPAARVSGLLALVIRAEGIYLRQPGFWSAAGRRTQTITEGSRFL